MQYGLRWVLLLEMALQYRIFTWCQFPKKILPSERVSHIYSEGNFRNDHVQVKVWRYTEYLEECNLLWPSLISYDLGYSFVVTWCHGHSMKVYLATQPWELMHSYGYLVWEGGTSSPDLLYMTLRIPFVGLHCYVVWSSDRVPEMPKGNPFILPWEHSCTTLEISLNASHARKYINLYHWRIQWSARDASPSPGPFFFHFHAVFRKICQNR